VEPLKKLRATSCSYLLPSKAQPASYARFAKGDLSAFSKSWEWIYCISYAPLRTSCFRVATGRPTSSVVAAFASPLHTLCERMRLTARAYSHSRGAFAPLHAHTCCLRKRNQPLTRASRATSLSAFSKSWEWIYCISYAPLRTSCFRVATGIRILVALSRHFMLIPVAFESATSLLRALRVRRVCLRFRRAGSGFIV